MSQLPGPNDNSRRSDDNSWYQITISTLTFADVECDAQCHGLVHKLEISRFMPTFKRSFIHSNMRKNARVAMDKQDLSLHLFFYFLSIR